MRLNCAPHRNGDETPYAATPPLLGRSPGPRDEDPVVAPSSEGGERVEAGQVPQAREEHEPGLRTFVPLVDGCDLVRDVDVLTRALQGIADGDPVRSTACHFD